MPTKPTEPEETISIVVKSSEVPLIESGIAGLMKHRKETRNEVLSYTLSLGLVMALKALCDAAEREQAVSEAIRKLKSQEPVSNDELEVILIAAKGGHLAAQIIMEDFKRFGRSMDKS